MIHLTHIKWLVLPIFLMCLSACSTQIKYLGNKYTAIPEGEEIKIFFKESDVSQNHEIMGRIYVKVKEDKNIEKIQNRILSKVRSVGGDAVLMGELKEIVTGEVTGSTGGSRKIGKKGRIGTSVTKSKNQYKDEIECQVYKYK